MGLETFSGFSKTVPCGVLLAVYIGCGFSFSFCWIGFRVPLGIPLAIPSGIPLNLP